MRKEFHMHPVHLPRVREELKERMSSDSEHIFVSNQIPQMHPHPSIQENFRTAFIFEYKTTTKCWLVYILETLYIEFHSSIN